MDALPTPAKPIAQCRFNIVRVETPSKTNSTQLRYVVTAMTSTTRLRFVSRAGGFTGPALNDV